MSELSDKYSWENYLVLQWVDFNKEYGIEVWKKINIYEAKKILPYYEVTELSSWELYFYDNKIKKNITKLQFYVVNDLNISQVFKQLNYNVEWLYLFKWKSKNWDTEYRIWFDVEIK